MSPDFNAAKAKVSDAAAAYAKSMGFLTAKMTAELLLHDKEEKREKVRHWLSDGADVGWKRHWDLKERRVPGTGKWFLDSVPFNRWRKGLDSPVLYCPGIRFSPLIPTNIVAGAGKSFMA
jgi:hypothetical protein